MSRPNVLFLFTDEQRADTLGAYGNARVQTPHLDRLAAGGIVFERAYVTQPVCTPSRSTIMTGLQPRTSGCTANNIALPEDVPCLPELLPPGEYVCGYHGKWHLGDEIFRQHGFDDWVSIDDMYRPHYAPGRDRSARSDYHHWLIERGVSPQRGDAFGRGEVARLAEPLSKPAFLAESAGRFIHANRDRPFVLYVNFLEPHMPFFGPRDSQYDVSQVTLPINFDAPPTDDQPLKTRLFARHYFEKGHSGLPLRTEADWRRMIANYWGMCSHVDTHVGAILRTLDDCGLTDGTLIVYTSDHGDMMGSHRLIAKCVMFEEAVRVPLIVKLPGQSAPRRVTGPVSQVDLVATLLDLMGEPAPSELEGATLRPELEGARDGGEEVFIEWNGDNNGLPGLDDGGRDYPDYLSEIADADAALAAITDPVRTVVTRDWKLNHSLLGESELYHLRTDPGETANRIADPDAASIVADLTDRLQRRENT